MNQRNIIEVVFLLSVTLGMYSCKKDVVSTTDDSQICSFVTAQNFDATGVIINDFLETQNDVDNDTKLLNLKNWLEKSSCIGNVEILCNSCIYTLPAQSELSVDFVSNGQTITKTMDILMGDTLSFQAYH